jgi:hypothetical protein
MTLPSTNFAWLPIGLVVASSADASDALTMPTAPAVAADANTVVIVVIFKMLHS